MNLAPISKIVLTMFTVIGGFTLSYIVDLISVIENSALTLLEKFDKEILNKLKNQPNHPLR